MKPKRIWAGLAIAVIAGFAITEAIALANVAISPAKEAVATGFVTTVLGAFVARRGFVAPALGLWLLSWAVCVCILYWIVEPTGQASILRILQYNYQSISLSGLAMLVGTFVGRAIAQRVSNTSAAT